LPRPHGREGRRRLFRRLPRRQRPNARNAERDGPSRLLRDLFRNPVHSPLPPAPSVLADDLEEAGCTDAELLGHLRSAGPPWELPGAVRRDGAPHQAATWS